MFPAVTSLCPRVPQVNRVGGLRTHLCRSWWSRCLSVVQRDLLAGFLPEDFGVMLPLTACSALLPPVEFPQRHDHPQGGGCPGRRLHRGGETCRRHTLLSPGPGRGEPLPCSGRAGKVQTRTLVRARKKQIGSLCLHLHLMRDGGFNLPAIILSLMLLFLDKTTDGGFSDVCRWYILGYLKTDMYP